MSNSQPAEYDGELHDVFLGDEPNETQKPPHLVPGVRPKPLRNAFHECTFVAIIALSAATPVFLQRSTIVVTASFGQALRMTPAQLAWVVAGSG